MRAPYLDDGDVRLYHGDVLDVLREMDAESVQTCVTSPPYWGLRDYGSPGQLGLEATPGEYVARMAEVFREVRRVLRDLAGLVFALMICLAVWAVIGRSMRP